MTKRELAEVFLNKKIIIHKQDIKKITYDNLTMKTTIEYYTTYPNKGPDVYDYCHLSLCELMPESQPISGITRWEVSYEIISREQGEKERRLISLERNIKAAQRDLEKALLDKAEFLKEE